MGHDLALLLFNKLRLVRNGWRERVSGNWRKRLAPISIVIWLGFLGYGFFSSFRFLQGILGEAARAVALEALSSAFLAGIVLVLVNGMRQMFDTFFISGDLTLLLSTPLSRRAIFIDRFLEGMVDNSTYGAMMVLPPGVAFLIVFGASWTAYVWLVVAFVLLLACLTAISVLLDLAVVRVVPAARARQVLVSLNMILILLIIILYNAFSVDLVRPDQMVNFLSTESVSSQGYLPATWMAHSIASLVPGYDLGFWSPALLLIGVSGGLSALSIWAAGTGFARGWGAAQESARPKRRRASAAVRSSNGGSPLRAFLTKDARYFLRDTRSWGMLLFGLVILGFFGISYARDMEQTSPLVVAAAAALLPAMGGLLSARWMLTVFSQEGEAWWVIQASPLRDQEIFGAKFVMNYALSSIYNVVTMILLTILSPIPLSWLPAAVAVTAILAVGTTAIGLAVAAWRTDMSQPQMQRRDIAGSYAIMGIIAAYVGLPVVFLTAFDEVPWLVEQIPIVTQLSTNTLTLLLAAFYLPVTAAVYLGMRAWALTSLRRIRVERQ
jgi:hypothetical protein